MADFEAFSSLGGRCVQTMHLILHSDILKENEAPLFSTEEASFVLRNENEDVYGCESVQNSPGADESSLVPASPITAGRQAATLRGAQSIYPIDPKVNIPHHQRWHMT
jgi:hypothetical protein